MNFSSLSASFEKNFSKPTVNSVNLLNRFLLLFALAPMLLFGQSTVTTFDTAGTFTWTAPSGITSITVQLWGGGGAGGGNSSVNNGAGGGGGGAFTTSVLAVVPGNTYTLSVGAGGIGSLLDGQDGTDSWFIDPLTLVAKAGKGGKAPIGATLAGGLGGAGGALSPGSGNYSGGNGAVGGRSIAPFAPAGGGGGGSSAGSGANGVDGNSPSTPIVQSLGGDGGIAPPSGGYGGDGGGYDNPNGLLNGVAAHSPGGGGGGAGNPPPFQPVLTGLGGNGAPGRIIIITGQAIFSKSGTWKAPACISSIVVEAWGGGGAGGGNDSTANGGGGGGGGAYSKSVISVTPGQTYAVTVGNGGLGVIGGVGFDGGDSWFINATTILAKGGKGGNPPINAGGAPGLGGLAAAGIGTTKFNGGDGGLGTNSAIGLGGGGGSSAGYIADGTVGGDAALLASVFVPAPGGVAPNGGGDGGDGQNNLLSGDGQSGFSPGGGGGGSSDIELGPGMKGGQGANGRIILSYPDPSIVIGDNPVAPDSICPSALDVPIHSFTLTGANGCNKETNITFTTTGSFVASEVLTFKLYYTTTNTFATTNLLATTSSTGPGIHAFPSIIRPAGSLTTYYWITMDVDTTVTEGNTLIVSQTLPADIVASPTPTGSGAASGTQTFKSAPKLSSLLSPPSICTGALFTYSPSSASIDSSFTWTRETIPGITEPGISGIGGVSEILTNTTSSPINVTYVYSTVSSANKCANPGENVVVVVNPLPQGSITGNTVCGADPADLGQLTWVATAGGGPYSIIYELGTVTEAGVISGTSFTVNPSPLVLTTYTITSVTDANSCARTSGFTRDTASIFVTAAPITIDLQPRDTSVCNGSTASFMVTGTGIYNYSWEVSTDGGTSWSNVAVAAGSQPIYTDSTTSSLQLSGVDTLHTNYLYRALLGPACGAVIDTSSVVTLTVFPTPELSSSVAQTTICSGSTFIYTPTTVSGTATYSWTRADVSGITEPGTTGTIPISETLSNTTKSAIDVIYNFIVTDGICDNGSGVDIVVNVSPSPALNSTLTPNAICSGDVFSYAPSSAELDTTFSWTRLPDPGIAGPATSGNDSINEVISNTTSLAIDVKYVYVTTTPDCSVGGLGDTVVVTVNAGGIISLATPVATDTQGVCINNAIDTIRYTIGGSGINASATGLPNGVTGIYDAGIYTITGSPIVDGVYTYTVNTFGECNQASATGVITVGLSLTSVDSTADQGVCINTPIQDITYAVGGPGETASAIGLPAGLTQVFDTATQVLTISGTPTEGGGFTYTVSTAGPCAINKKTGKVTVGISLISIVGTDSQKVCLGDPLINITYRLIGGDSLPVAVGLPDGLTGSITSPGVYTIIGTPTTAGLFNYTITTTGSCAGQSSETGKVIVSVGRISAVGTDSQKICKNTPIVPIDYFVVGGGLPVVTGLPNGVTGDTISSNIFRITGTPTVAGEFNYTISTQGSCGTPAEITSRMIVGLGLVSPIGSDSQFVCVNAPIAPILYEIVEGDIPPPTVVGLPAGFTTGFISPGIFAINGTPTTPGLISYTITANGTCNSNSSVTGKIIAGIGLLSATGTDTSQVICKSTSPITPIVYSVVGGGTTSVDGLPDGLTGSTTTPGNPAIFTISGTPSKAGTYKYYVTSAGGTCASATVEGLIVVNETTLDTTAVSGNKTQWICANTAIEDVVFKIGGTATGAVVSTLPKGLTGKFDNVNKTFTISGTPDAQVLPGDYSYTVTTTGGICTQSTSVFKLTIYDPIAKFTADTLSGKNPLLVQFTNESENADTYSWTFGDSQLSEVEHPSNGYLSAGTYTVVMVASQGLRCPDTTSAVINVIEAYTVIIPSVFTPNGDGTNDTYKIIADDVERLSVEIFNRWGQQVAGWNTNFEGWDGTNMNNGKDCSDGTYFVIISVLTNDGVEVNKTDFFTLMR